jgi:FkbM family methyltransferase
MLIHFNQLKKFFTIPISGIFHVGAHECEELRLYNEIGIPSSHVYWVEAMSDKVSKMKSIHVPNVFQGLIDEVDGKNVTFHITNNGESSSILEFGSHSHHHPHVHVVTTENMTTTRLDTLIEANNIPIDKLNFLNLDIQGVELRALKSMEKYLQHIQYIYTEVNSEYVYKDCNLVGEIDAYLKPYGFERVCTKMCGNFGWGDALYVKST